MSIEGKKSKSSNFEDEVDEIISFDVNDEDKEKIKNNQLDLLLEENINSI